MTVIGSPTATGSSSRKPAEVEEAKTAGVVDRNHVGQYDLIKKDLMDFTGVSA